MKRIQCFLIMAATVQLAAAAAGAAPPAGDESGSAKPVTQPADQSVRIATFLADPDGKQPHNFPAWNNCRKLVGEGKSERTLFIEMLKAEPGLCAAVDGDAKQFNELLNKRVHDFAAIWHDRSKFKRQNGSLIGPPTLRGSAAAILFAAADPSAASNADLDRQLEGALISVGLNLGMLPPFNRTPNATDPDVQKVLKILMTRWASREEDPKGTIHQWNVARTFKLAGARVPLALQFLRHPEATTVAAANGLAESAIEFAIIAVAKSGDKKNIALLAPHLQDSQRIPGYQDSQMRDLALWAIVALSGGKPADYRLKPNELTSAFPEDSRADVSLFSTIEDRNLGFAKCVMDFKALGLERPPQFFPETPPRFAFVEDEKPAQHGEPRHASPDGKVRLDLMGNKARLVDVATGKPIGKELAAGWNNSSQKYAFTCWSFSPDGKVVVTGSAFHHPPIDQGDPPINMGQVQVWDAATGELLESLHTPGGTPTAAGSVRSVIFGKDGKTIYYDAEPYYRNIS